MVRFSNGKITKAVGECVSHMVMLNTVMDGGKDLGNDGEPKLTISSVICDVGFSQEAVGEDFFHALNRSKGSAALEGVREVIDGEGVGDGNRGGWGDGVCDRKT